MIGVLLDLNLLVEDGIGRLGYGRKVKVIHLKCIIRNECRGKLKNEFSFFSNPCSESDFFILFRVSSSIYSGDARFVLTGSGDGNVRIWKAKASDKLGVINARERAAMEYRESLKERWKVDSEVNKVARSVFFIPLNHYIFLAHIFFICSPSTRHLPKSVYQTSKLKRTMLEAQRVKEERRRKHTREGEAIPKPERKKLVVAEQS